MKQTAAQQQRVLYNAQLSLERFLSVLRDSLLERIASIESQVQKRPALLAEVRQLRDKIEARLR